MKLPLIVVDTHDEVDVFSSPESVSAWLEAPDVRDNEFRLFDANGVEYALLADSDASPVVVGPPVSGQPGFDHVLSIARDYLDRLPARVRGKAPLIELQTPEDVSRALGPFAR
jgi:hypothetical protein